MPTIELSAAQVSDYINITELLVCCELTKSKAEARR
jgi:hypothetical protein